MTTIDNGFTYSANQPTRTNARSQNPADNAENRNTVAASRPQSSANAEQVSSGDQVTLSLEARALSRTQASEKTDNDGKARGEDRTNDSPNRSAQQQSNLGNGSRAVSQYQAIEQQSQDRAEPQNTLDRIA